MSTAEPLASAATGRSGRHLVELHPRLLEEAVLLRIESQSAQVRRRFRRQRDPLYEIVDACEREDRFQRLHETWCAELRIAQPVHRCIAELLELEGRASRFVVVPVTSAKEEFADAPPTAAGRACSIVLIRLRVGTLVDEPRLVGFLRRELRHVADMLDPEFGFAPSLSSGEESRALESVLRDRYRVLWRTSVDGRLVGAGRLDPAAEESRRREFRLAFPMLGAAGDSLFARFFSGPRPTHGEMVAFARSPGDATAQAPRLGCPLCRMPSATLHPRPAALSTRARERLAVDFPDWRPELGICRQCADLLSGGAR